MKRNGLRPQQAESLMKFIKFMYTTIIRFRYTVSGHKWLGIGTG